MTQEDIRFAALPDFPGYTISTTGGVFKVHEDGTSSPLSMRMCPRSGNLTVVLRDPQGIHRVKWIATLVLTAFGVRRHSRLTGRNYRAGPLYRDGDPRNCRLENLKWPHFRDIRPDELADIAHAIAKGVPLFQIAWTFGFTLARIVRLANVICEEHGVAD